MHCPNLERLPTGQCKALCAQGGLTWIYGSNLSAQAVYILDTLPLHRWLCSHPPVADFARCLLGRCKTPWLETSFAARRGGSQLRGPAKPFQGRIRQQIATAAFWGSGDDRRPSSKNVLDTTMAWGDILTLLATELVSTHPPHIHKTSLARSMSFCAFFLSICGGPLPSAACLSL